LKVCRGTKRDGSHCTLPARGVNGYCWAHDPANAEQRRLAASRGGRHAGRGRSSVELHRLQQRFEDLADQVLSEEVDRAVGAVAGQLLNGARACIRDTLVARDQEQVLEEMEELREALEAQRARRPSVS
jgi:hypothetical protein